MLMYRHGDVLLIREGDLPTTEPAASETEIVVAEGEITGHAHRVRGQHAALIDHGRGRITLDVPEGGRIAHEEHRTLVLEPGRYVVRHQRTMAQPGVWERVAD